MTYCLALRLDEGLIFLSDTRTNAGVDNVGTYRKLHVFQPAPDRVFVAISADFDDALTMGEAETLVERLEKLLKARQPKLSSIYIRPEKREDAVDASVIG